MDWQDNRLNIDELHEELARLRIATDNIERLLKAAGQGEGRLENQQQVRHPDRQPHIYPHTYPV